MLCFVKCCFVFVNVKAFCEMALCFLLILLYFAKCRVFVHVVEFPIMFPVGCFGKCVVIAHVKVFSLMLLGFP